MSDYKTFKAEYKINRIELLESVPPEDFIKERLLSDLIREVVKEPDTHILIAEDDLKNMERRYTLQMVVIDPVKFKKLRDIITKIDLHIVDDNGVSIRLIDLL